MIDQLGEALARLEATGFERTRGRADRIHDPLDPDDDTLRVWLHEARGPMVSKHKPPKRTWTLDRFIGEFGGRVAHRAGLVTASARRRPAGNPIELAAAWRSARSARLTKAGELTPALAGYLLRRLGCPELATLAAESPAVGWAPGSRAKGAAAQLRALAVGGRGVPRPLLVLARDVDGQPADVVRRQIGDGPGPKGMRLPSARRPLGVRRPFLLEGSLADELDRARRAGLLLVCEGELDFITAAALRRAGVAFGLVGLLGAGEAKHLAAALLERDPRELDGFALAIATDADEAGDKAAGELLEPLAHHAEVQRLQLPAGADLLDEIEPAARAGGLEGAARVMRELLGGAAGLCEAPRPTVEARAEAARVMREAVDFVTSGRKLRAAIAAVAPGAGKSFQLAALAVEMAPQRPVVIAVPRHDLLDATTAAICERAGAGVVVSALRGARVHCQRRGMWPAVAAWWGELGRRLCQSCHHADAGCPGPRSPGERIAKAKAGEILVVAHGTLAALTQRQNEAAQGAGVLLLIDERPDPLERIEIDLAAAADTLAAREADDAGLRAWRHLPGATAAPALARELLDQLRARRESWRTKAELGGKAGRIARYGLRVDLRELVAEMPPAHRRRLADLAAPLAKAVEALADVEPRSWLILQGQLPRDSWPSRDLLRLLADLAAPEGAWSIEAAMDLGGDAIRLAGRRRSTLPHLPTVIADGTGATTAEIHRAHLAGDRAVKLIASKLRPPARLRVFHLVSSNYTRGRLLTRSGQLGAGGAARVARALRLAGREVVAALRPDRRLRQGNKAPVRLGLLTYKPVADQLRTGGALAVLPGELLKQGLALADEGVGHFGGVRGSNSFQGLEALVLFGDELGNLGELGADARALGIEAESYVDAVRREALEQNLHRLRAIARPDEDLALVVIGRHAPDLGLPVVQLHDQGGRPLAGEADERQALEDATAWGRWAGAVVACTGWVLINLIRRIAEFDGLGPLEALISRHREAAVCSFKPATNIEMACGGFEATSPPVTGPPQALSRRALQTLRRRLGGKGWRAVTLDRPPCITAGPQRPGLGGRKSITAYIPASEDPASGQARAQRLLDALAAAAFPATTRGEA